MIDGDGHPRQVQRNPFVTLIQTAFVVFLLALLAFCAGVLVHTAVRLFEMGWDQITL